LAEWYDIARPGRYWVQLVFNNRDGGFANGGSHEVLFDLADRASK
jgi:hypothetical protein